jgi:cysteine-rich repeat protein
VRSIVVCSIALLLGGCGLLLDLDPPDPQLGIDAGRRDGGAGSDGGDDGGSPSVTCDEVPEGASCGIDPPQLCIAGTCRRSRCGDGFVDTRLGEECEDGNDATNDGCEPGSCRVTCREDVDCGVTGPCITATCVDAMCIYGLHPRDTICRTLEGREGFCSGGRCVGEGCGNGALDPGEACDDGNATRNDGCEPDCTRTCERDGECDDGVACNGVERCLGEDDELPLCVRGPAPTPPPCTVCDPTTGAFALVDRDRDGFAPGDCGDRGGDCDDGDASVFPGAPDLGSPGNGRDDDCDGAIDEDVAVVCMRDADGDGFGDASVLAAPMRTGCPSGFVPVPVGSARTDCDDADPDVFPGQTEWFSSSRCLATDPVGGCFDYDCNGVEEQRWAASCGRLLGVGCEGEGWLGEVPRCGEVGSFGRCTLLGALCTGFLGRSQTQQCR